MSHFSTSVAQESRLNMFGVQVYKQKLKHVLSEHHNVVAELKIDGVAASSLIQNQHREAELELRKDIQAQQAEFREKECYNQNCLEELQLVSLTSSFRLGVRFLFPVYNKSLLGLNRNSRWS